MCDKISVIMSIYNEKLEWIKESIESILNQSYLNIEVLLIVDNPFLENTIRDYLEKVEKRDERVSVIYNEQNLGLALTLNKGINLAKGTYIARMDADDISERNRLEIELCELKKRKLDCIGSGKILINEKSEIIATYENIITGSKRIARTLPHANCFVHPSVLIKKEIIQKVGGYRNFRQSQDYDLWLRLNESGCHFDNVDIPLIRYRIRESGITGKKPYVQYLTSKYQRLLYVERIKKGKDSFSDKKFEEYLDRCNAYNIDKNKKYLEGLQNLNLGISTLKNSILKGIFLIVKSILVCNDMAEVFYRKMMAVYYRMTIKENTQYFGEDR